MPMVTPSPSGGNGGGGAATNIFTVASPQHESSFFGLHFATACSSEASPSTRRTKAGANRIL